MGGVEEDFCKNYLLLEAEEASFFDCFQILHSNDFQKNGFFNTRIEGEVIGFRRRWIIFVSLMLQKALLFLKKPLAAAGAAVEEWLNYPPFNGGYRRLFFNFVTGRVVKPEKRSSTFTSIVGNFDKRWDLKINNKNINAESSIAIMASKLSYENQAFARNVVNHKWQMEFLGFYSFWNDFQEQETTYAIMFRDPTRIVVAFRGTEPFDADQWRTNVDISWYDFAGVGKLHAGFSKALGLQKSTGFPKEISPSNPKSYAYYTMRRHLKTLMHENSHAKLLLTGHSLGGALAILFAGVLAMHEEEFLLRRLEGVYTFGQPRVGNEQFGEWMKQKMRVYDVKYFRYVYCYDLVARLPCDDKTLMFKHVGDCLYFNSCYKGQVLEEEPDKNYFSLLYVVPKISNAAMEFIRSLILPWIEGEEYREGWLVKLFRVIAFVLPGLIDHFPREYHNVSRLGKIRPIY